MGFDSLREWLRWAFWGLAYFTTLVTAYVIFWALVPLSSQIRWCFLSIIAIGIAVDVIHKTRPEPAPTPRPRH